MSGAGSLAQAMSPLPTTHCHHPLQTVMCPSSPFNKEELARIAQMMWSTTKESTRKQYQTWITAFMVSKCCGGKHKCGCCSSMACSRRLHRRRSST